jgi:hypothetical protein
VPSNSSKFSRDALNNLPRRAEPPGGEMDVRREIRGAEISWEIRREPRPLFVNRALLP